MRHSGSSRTPRGLFPLFLLVDIGFLVYWSVTFLELLPPEYLYKDHDEPIMVDWNWSFFPIDMLISFSGLNSLRLHRKGSEDWRSFAILSLLLTSCSGLMAVSFWSFRGDLDPAWWLPNLFLLGYPLYYLPRLMKADTQQGRSE
jgi:hypothetical protein